MLLSAAQLEESAQINPDVAKILSKLPQTTKTQDSPTAGLRATLAQFDRRMLERLGPPSSDLTEVYHDVTMRDGYLSKIKIHRTTVGKPGPLIVLAYSGAFIAGTNNQLSDIARCLSVLFGATAVNISYRLAPEHPFPAAQNDGIDSMRWIAQNAGSDILRADPSLGFIIGGVSAGGTLAACLSRFFEKEPLAHPLTGQWLGCAGLMDGTIVPSKFRPYFTSREQNAHAPILSTAAIDHGAQEMKADASSELRFPLNSKAKISAQPKTYMQVCGLDPYRDDGLIYEEMLKEAGVQTAISFYSGCPHAFWMLCTGSEVGDNALIDVIAGHAWLLGKTVSREDVRPALKI